MLHLAAVALYLRKFADPKAPISEAFVPLFAKENFRRRSPVLSSVWGLDRFNVQRHRQLASQEVFDQNGAYSV